MYKFNFKTLYTLGLIVFSTVLFTNKPAFGISSEDGLSMLTSESCDFSDSNGDWSSDYIEELCENEIVSGYNDQSFRASNQVTRAEFTKMILTGTGADQTGSSMSSSFKDVSSSDWFYNIVQIGVGEGYLVGYADGSFKPNASITRAEALSVLIKALDLDLSSDFELDFSDVDPSNWATEYIATALDLGFIDGYSDNSFKPNQAITRGEAAKIIFLALDSEGYQDFYQDEELSDSGSDDSSDDSNDGPVTYTFDVESSEDCYDFETFDPEEMTCSLECESELACQLAYDGLEDDTAIDDAEESYFDDDNSNSEDSSGEGIIAEYEVSGDSIENMSLGDSASQYQEFADDLDAHQMLWDSFSSIIPLEDRSLVTNFAVFTDGKDEVLAYVEPVTDDLNEWVLAIDITDAIINGELETEELPGTFIHEFAHVLSLNNDQIDAGVSCAALYELSEGCAHDDAYLTGFIEQFWSGVLDEFNDANGDPDALYEFYDRNADQFVTEYAATDPVEDFAETFAAFVLQDKPNGDTIAEEKILYMYENEFLTSLRTRIRAGLVRSNN